MMKRALITGITGQDGSYLARVLLEHNYEVYGTYRPLSTPNFWRLMNLGIFSKCKLIPVDLIDLGSIIDAIRKANPHEIYNMAAVSFVMTTFQQPIGISEINAISVTKILEAIRFVNPKIKFYQASTSEMFGNSKVRIQNENTPFNPASPYATAKLYSHSIVDIYRKGFNIFGVGGLLFNHESPLRILDAVSRKISNEVAKIHLGLSKKIFLGNIDARRDWGYAPEFMEGVYLMMQQKDPEDFVLSTGETHSVKEFVKLAFELVGLNWKNYVKIDKKLIRPIDVDSLCGDYKKAKRKLGWSPKTKFNKLVKIMLEEDIKRWKMLIDGKFLPWDAPLYPTELKVINKIRKKLN